MKRWWRPVSGLTISLLLHAVVAGVLLLSLIFQPEPQAEEQVVEVSLVAPPEPAAEEPPAEAAKPEEPAAEEPKAPEPPPAPEPEKPEAEPPPPPEPPPAAPQAEEQPKLPDAGQAPIPVLRPVVKFAEKDSGPEISKGTEAEADLTPETAAELEEAEQDVAAATPQPDIDLPEATLPEEAPMPDAAAEAAEGEGAEAAPPAAPQPTAEEKKAAEAKAAAEAKEKPIKEAALVPRTVKKLFSHAISGDEAAATGMAGLNRQERGFILCGTELSQQLRRGKPSFTPFALPVLPLKQGNVVEAPLTAFRDIGGDWINIGVRCEVDDDVTQVLKFSLSVGKPVPKSEWRARGFLDF
ncbi:DUF930 domain-containing protein [Rhizobium glycinendophyticum]|uniref:DUF930 domain-containing protein n=1 Tax=Rhizobium glycinendophyticum TaxID=2589807 RepID=A0A504UAM3_9HYPH|nr:DUF930 domain-containing protein [Rhizobium glycinendophyticum]TPP11539.1 DUF930 domain-containing protein [Rhizobium glycinendophyticum]